MHCLGWDSFGLPAENAAFERSEEPDQWTQKFVERFYFFLFHIRIRMEYDVL